MKRYSSEFDREEEKYSKSFFALSYENIFRSLQFAITEGTITNVHAVLERIVNERYNINYPAYGDCKTALHLAVLTNDVAKIEAVLRAGAIQAISDEYEVTPLFLAAQKNLLNALICLLRQSGPQSYRFSGVKQQTLLHVAVLCKASDVLACLLDTYGYDKDFVDAKDSFGETALQKAASCGQRQYVDMLLRANANPTIIQNRVAPNSAFQGSEQKIKEFDDLRVAISSENPDEVHRAIRALLNAGYDINTPYYIQGTALHLAVKTDRDQIVQVLLTHRANPFIANNFGVNSFFLCAVSDTWNSLVCLLKNVRTFRYDERGLKNRNLLHVAAYFKAPVVTRCLLTIYGKDQEFVNAQDLYGETPLHLAAAKGNRHLVEMLIREGARQDILNGKQRTYLQMGRAFGHDVEPEDYSVADREDYRLANR